jgi:ribosome-binding factor A
MNSSSIHWRRNASALCAELGPEDGIDPRVLARTRQESKSFCRKEQQLCKEVARLLSLILAGETAHPLLRGLQIVGVEAEDSGRQLCVTLGHAHAVAGTEADILEALASVRGHWRTALAHSLRRRRMPALRYRYLGRLEEV